MPKKQNRIEDRHNIDFIDKQIRRIYHSNEAGRGKVKAFSERHGIPRHQIRNRALKLGVAVSITRSPEWTEVECDLLEKHYFKAPGSIRNIFYRAGFNRSETSIMVKRKRMKLFVGLADVYSASSLASIMGTDVKAVTRWVSLGYLKASKKGTNRTPQQGGDSFLIYHKNVREFIIDNVAIVDTRKIDKYWLVDLLANK